MVPPARHRCSHLPASGRWFLALALTAGLGLVVSALTANDSAWWSANLSWLGADARAALPFSVTFLLLALLLLGVAWLLWKALCALVQHRVLGLGRAVLLPACLAAIALGLLLVGVFPINSPRSAVIHTAGAYGAGVIPFGLMLAVGRLIPTIGGRFVVTSLTLVALVAGMFGLGVWSDRLPYPAMEILVFLVYGLWLWALYSRLQTMARTLHPSDAAWWRRLRQ